MKAEQSGNNRQLLFAVFMFVVACGVSYGWINSRVGEYENQPKVQLLRAKKAIPAGKVINAESLSTIEIREDYASPSAYRKSDQSEVIGLATNVDIPEGDFIQRGYFSAASSTAYKLSGLVTPDMRAVSLPVDETNSLARSIVTGDKIDINFSFQIAGLPQRLSTVLLQNVPVVSTGTFTASEGEIGTASERSRRYNSLTLLLGANDANRLTYARQVGQIQIMLRSDKDSAQLEFPAFTGIEDILTSAERARVEQVIKARESAVGMPSADKMRDQMKEVFDARRQTK